MSFQAISWAFEQKLERSSAKFVLVCLANFANETFESYPSTQTLEDLTSMDRKTVVERLDDLTSLGFITDTGRRVGITNQIKVYRLNRKESIPKTEASQKRNYSVFPSKDTENGIPKAPVFPMKGSQKRDTEPVQEPVQEPITNRRGVGESSQLPFEQVRLRLCTLFKRKPQAPWGNDEEHYLLDVVKRPEVLPELSEIESFFSRGTFLPRTLRHLLQDWTNQLDRARNDESKDSRNKPPESDSIAMQEMKKELRRLEREDERKHASSKSTL